MTYEGGCLCGAVRFRVEAEPVRVRACWCRLCQYLAAGNATINVVFPTDAVTITGDTRDFISTADSGNRMHRRFCPHCGTQISSAAEERPHLIILRAGTLDEPGRIRPAHTIWTKAAPHWALIDPDIPHDEGQPG